MISIDILRVGKTERRKLIRIIQRCVLQLDYVIGFRNQSRFGLSQWEMKLQYNVVSQWLSPYTDDHRVRIHEKHTKYTYTISFYLAFVIIKMKNLLKEKTYLEIHNLCFYILLSSVPKLYVKIRISQLVDVCSFVSFIPLLFHVTKPHSWVEMVLKNMFCE